MLWYTQMIEDNEFQCQSCGKIYPNPVAYHSGTRECSNCWDMRKIFGPAARYWIKAIDNLFSNENGAGPDMNDYLTWKRWGIRDEIVDALNTLDALRDRYEIEYERVD